MYKYPILQGLYKINQHLYNLSMKKSLFKSQRFKWFEEENLQKLKNLTLEESAEIMEDLIEFAEEFIDNFSKDEPVCLKLSLRKNVKRSI